jgi:hypothetical protein
MEKVKCTQCQERGHFTRHCPKEQCPNCKQYGHGFKDCYVPISASSVREKTNRRTRPLVAAAMKVVIHSATVPLEGARPAAKQLTDDTNVVQKSLPSPDTLLG